MSLPLFDMVVDSRTNLFEERGIDASTGKDDASKGERPNLLVGLVTRLRAKNSKTAVQTIVGHFIEEGLGGPDIKSGSDKKIIEEMQPIQLIYACGLDLEF